MSLRSTCSLGLRTFARPAATFIRPSTLLRVNLASALPKSQNHSIQNRLGHSTSKTPALAPTNLQMETMIPGFSQLGVDAKLTRIQALKSVFASESQKNDPRWQPGVYDAEMEKLARKEKEIEDADRWYKKAFRSIAWGPTILVNAVLSLFWL